MVGIVDHSAGGLDEQLRLLDKKCCAGSSRLDIGGRNVWLGRAADSKLRSVAGEPGLNPKTWSSGCATQDVVICERERESSLIGLDPEFDR